ncbi:MAG: plsX [Gammaproteobacteria bacterium]|jgi:glycerol-3-phosphate acyltransferase PlsX|nr:plsX [Gammaproteobacteria bacterium]
MIKIAIDAMGGDRGPRVTVPAAVAMTKKYGDLHLILVGDEAVIRRYLRAIKADTHERLSIHHTDVFVAMDESPVQALRSKKETSSMGIALNLVKQGQAQACVSAGNTGALMVLARFILRTLANIDRPALIHALPTSLPDKCVRVLDLGANVDSSPEQLVEFAVMGSVLTRAVDNIEKPTVALLNVGTEEIKGNELVKKTAELLTQQSHVNYIGYIEGHHIYSGKANVVVCDGFVGNVSLKASEGLAKLILGSLKEGFQANIFTKLAGLAALGVLKKVRRKLDPERYNGASLVGLQGIVIKSHGHVSENAFANAIHEAIVEVQKDVPSKINEEILLILKEKQSA